MLTSYSCPLDGCCYPTTFYRTKAKQEKRDIEKEKEKKRSTTAPSTDSQLRHAFLYLPEDRRVGLGLDALRQGARAVGTLEVLALGAGSAVGGIGWELGLADDAGEARYRLGAKDVAGVADGVLVLLCRIARTVGAADVLAARAGLVARDKELVALAAVAAQALARLLVDEVLAAVLGRDTQNNGLARGVPVGDDGSVRLLLLEDLGAAFAAGNLLGLGALGRVPRALLAAHMLALGAFLGRAELGVALVAHAVDAHADGLVDPQGIALDRVPFAGLDFEAEPFAELAGTLFMQLHAWHPRGLGAFGFLSFGRIGTDMLDIDIWAR